MERDTRSTAAAWDGARLVIGIAVIAVAFAATWGVSAENDDVGVTPLAIAGLIAALVGLFSDLLLQRAVIGQNVDPLVRLVIRVALAATLLGYSLFDLVRSQFQDGGQSFGDSYAKVLPLVGAGPVLGVVGALVVIVGPWRDRFVLPATIVRGIAGGLGGCAALICGYQAIAAIIGANDFGDGLEPPVLASTAWFVMAGAGICVAWGMATSWHATWGLSSVILAAWAPVAFWQVAFNRSAPTGAGYEDSAAGVDVYFRAFGTLGAALLLGALVVAAAPQLSTGSSRPPGLRWLGVARSMMLVVAVSLIVVLVESAFSISDESDSRGALIWCCIFSAVGAIGAVICWRLLTHSELGKLVTAAWSVVLAVCVGITLLASDTLRQIVSTDFRAVARTSGLLAAGIFTAPLAVLVVLVVPPSVRRETGAMLPANVRNRLTSTQQDNSADVAGQASARGHAVPRPTFDQQQRHDRPADHQVHDRSQPLSGAGGDHPDPKKPHDAPRADPPSDRQTTESWSARYLNSEDEQR